MLSFLSKYLKQYVRKKLIDSEIQLYKCLANTHFYKLSLHMCSQIYNDNDAFLVQMIKLSSILIDMSQSCYLSNTCILVGHLPASSKKYEIVKFFIIPFTLIPNAKCEKYYFTWQQELLKLVLCHRVTSGSHPKKLHT